MRIVRTGDLVDDATSLVRIASGEETINVTANTVSTVDVLFPAGRFTAPPDVIVGAISGAPQDIREVTVVTRSLDGATIGIFRTNSVNTGVKWIARQE